MFRKKPKASDYINALKAESTDKNRDLYLKQGAPKKTFGTPMALIRKLVGKLKKECGTDEILLSLCKDLWKSQITEARMLAVIACPPELVSKTQLRKWSKSLSHTKLADLFVNELVIDTEWSEELLKDWKKSSKEMLLHCAYRILQKQANTANQRPDDYYIAELYQIEKEYISADEIIRTAMDESLLCIGKRNRKLNTVAMKVSARIEGVAESKGLLNGEERNSSILSSKKIQDLLPD